MLIINIKLMISCLVVELSLESLDLVHDEIQTQKEEL